MNPSEEGEWRISELPVETIVITKMTSELEQNLPKREKVNAG